MFCRKFDYVSYFDLTGQPLPDNRQGIFEKLLSDRLIETDVGNHYNITNLGAVLFAKRFADFSPSIARNAVRFVAYRRAQPCGYSDAPSRWTARLCERV